MKPMTLASAGGVGGGIALALIFVLWAAVIIGSLVIFILSLVDIVRRPDWQWRIAGQEKILWILLILLVNFLAIPSLIYWFNIRKKLQKVADAAAAGHFGPGHMTFSGWEPGPPMAATTGGWSPGWYSDPTGKHRVRWWDGMQWTEHVNGPGAQAGSQ